MMAIKKGGAVVNLKESQRILSREYLINQKFLMRKNTIYKQLLMMEKEVIT